MLIANNATAAITNRFGVRGEVVVVAADSVASIPPTLASGHGKPSHP
jgi:hypothetical protein